MGGSLDELIWDYFWIGLYKGFEYKEHPLFLKI
jgi:hypothetical protein